MSPHVLPLALVGWSVERIWLDGWSAGFFFTISSEGGRLHFHAPIGALVLLIFQNYILLFRVNDFWASTTMYHKQLSCKDGAREGREREVWRRGRGERGMEEREGRERYGGEGGAPVHCPALSLPTS